MLEVRLREVFVQALDLDPDVAVESLGYRSHQRWDSLGHMSLVVEMEDTFDVELTADEIIGMDSFGAALKILIEHGVE